MRKRIKGHSLFRDAVVTGQHCSSVSGVREVESSV